MNRRGTKSTREHGQPDLFPQKSQEHGLNTSRSDNQITVEVRKRLLIAWLADHDKGETREDRLADQFLDITPDATSLSTDCCCVHENERLSRRFIHSLSLLPHYAEGRGRRR